MLKIKEATGKCIYIAGNETMERLATYGLTANFMVYLMREFQMDQVVAANILNIWSAASNFATIIGALIADNYLGKFRTIALGSFASLAVRAHLKILLLYLSYIYVQINLNLSLDTPNLVVPPTPREWKWTV
jgi:dipeptide/tripeptide permease